jgi:hypothetical protein
VPWLVVAAGPAALCLALAIPLAALSSNPDRPSGVGVVVMAVLATLPELATRSRRRAAYSDVFIPSEAILAFGLVFASPMSLIGGRLIAITVSETTFRHHHPAEVVLNIALGATETVAALAVYQAVLGDRTATSPVGYGATAQGG